MMHDSCSTTRLNSETTTLGTNNDHNDSKDNCGGGSSSSTTGSSSGGGENNMNETSDGVHSRRHPNESTSPSQPADATGTTGSFECNICLDPARDAVVSMCGHLFCWPCLHRWFETSELRPVCPVCKAAISRDKVIPLYGRGGDHTQDPRTKIPPRPSGQRTEPDPGLGGFGNTLGSLFGGSDSNFRMSVGIGAFPFGFLATTFNFGGGSGYSASTQTAAANNNNNNNSNSPFSTNSGPNRSQSEMLWGNDSEMMSKLCLFVAIFFIGWLLIA